MKKTILKIVVLLFISFKTASLQAQPVITEYVLMHPLFRLDVTDIRVQKMISTKNIVDIEWNERKRTLAVSYYVGKGDLKNVVQSLLKISETAPVTEQKTQVKAMPVTPF